MATFLVERYLLSEGLDQLVASLAPLRGTQRSSVRYLASTFVPDDETCLCLFEACTAGSVATANERAGLPFDRIVRALVLDERVARWLHHVHSKGEP